MCVSSSSSAAAAAFISIISSIKKVEASAPVSEIGQKSNENNNFCEPRRSDDSTDNDVCPSPPVGGIEFEQIKMERKRKAEEDDLMVGWICFGVRLLHRFIGCTDRSHFLAMSSFHFTLNPFAIRKGDQRSDIRWNNSPLFAMPVVVGRADDALLNSSIMKLPTPVRGSGSERNGNEIRTEPRRARHWAGNPIFKDSALALEHGLSRSV